MSRKEIRLRYSGLIIFASRLLSVATGLAFVLMITRSVSPEEFGIWGNIGDLLAYFILLSGIIPFWATRFVAREHTGSAKTCLIANVLISIASVLVYLALLPTILSAFQVSTYAILYVVVSIQILELYTIAALEAVLQVIQPEVIGYSFLITEVCKVALGFVLIMILKLGLLGGILSIIIANIVQIAFYMKLAIKELRESMSWSYLKEWLKASPINLYNIIGGRITSFTLILLFIYGELARSYYQAAITIANIIGYSTSLAFALYPKLLSQTDTEDVSTSFKMVLMYAIPMTTGAIILSDSYLTILSSDYAEAKLVLPILVVTTFNASLSQVFNTIIMGTEKIDAKAKIPFKQLIKTRLFQVFTLPYIQSAITLPTTFFALFYMAKTQLEAATYLALIALIAESAMLVGRYAIAQKCLTFNLPLKSIAKYTIASSIMAAFLFAVPHPERLTSTIALTILGGTIYFATLATIDQETRELIRLIIAEVKSKQPRTKHEPN
jgi:O-antigen/teichoic acid export membrane protein